MPSPLFRGTILLTGTPFGNIEVIPKYAPVCLYPMPSCSLLWDILDRSEHRQLISCGKVFVFLLEMACGCGGVDKGQTGCPSGFQPFRREGIPHLGEPAWKSALIDPTSVAGGAWGFLGFSIVALLSAVSLRGSCPSIFFFLFNFFFS